MHVGIIGWPLTHSLSPAMFRAAFERHDLDWRYDAFPIAPGDLAGQWSRLRISGLHGFNVTIPHKQDIIPFLDSLSSAAGAIGAVNCVAHESSGWTGHNTDASAFATTLAETGNFDATGKRAVVLGAGGAARAVLHALAGAGISAITLLARRPAQAERIVHCLGAGPRGSPPAVRIAELPCPAERDVRQAISEADLMVNTTPVDMTGSGIEGGSPIDLALVSAEHRPGFLVYDLIYRPRETVLLRAARERGARTLDGLPMLAFQAAEAFTLWTGTTMSGAEMLRVAEEIEEAQGG